jgi:diaminopimelate epimerase
MTNSGAMTNEAARGAPLHRMNGLGNRIAVLDLRGRAAVATEAVARAAATRIPFDQMMSIHDPVQDGTAARITIHNIDGSEAGACGNGMRCVAEIMLGEGGPRSRHVETARGLLSMERLGPALHRVDMGAPQIGWREIPLSRPFGNTVSVPLDEGHPGAGMPRHFTAVSMGNPHAVFVVDDVEAHDLARTGPMLEHHPLFPERANIGLAHVTARDALTLKVWERGAGLTLACGSGACAAAVAAHRRGLTGREVAVTLPGGTLGIHWQETGSVLMTGPVEHEETMAFDPDWAFAP